MMAWYEKPWGGYFILDQGPGYLVKRLVVNSGHQTSLQRHTGRSEVWIVIQGQATVDNGADIWHLKASSIDQCDMLIEAGEWHRIKSTGIEPLIIIETWLGTDLREDDIERKEDRYGRV